MKTLIINKNCADFKSYRAARVKSMFNAESGANFSLSAELPADDTGWSLGIIVGPSGSGKTSLGERFWDGVPIYNYHDGWDHNAPIIDCIAAGGDFNMVTSALAAVGLGDVPAWLRPYYALSNGEKFRAGLARVIAEAPPRVIIDEFTSVIDRQIARFGALAFQKSWRRIAKTGGNQCVLLSCHRDILEWLEPDWVFDTADGSYSERRRRRPEFKVEIWKTGWNYWPFFEPHHYLKIPPMIAAKCYVGTVDGKLVCHVAMGCKNKGTDAEARGCRLVVMPEWQGAGVGLRFLNQICQWNLEGADGGRFPGRPVTTIFHTSHPGLCIALRRDRRWRQVSAALFGANKQKSITSIRNSAIANGREIVVKTSGYGGHFRAVQGFRYIGEQGLYEAKLP
jgi:GNAT superfamily N-acetyltransferase